MHGVDGQRPIDFDRISHFDLESGCHGGGNKIDTGSNRTQGTDFTTGQTRKASPFEDFSGNPPMLTSYVPKSRETSQSGMDSDLKDVLRKLINWLSDSKKSDNADGTTSTGETSGNKTENNSEKQLLAMVLMLLILEMQGKNSNGNSTSGSNSKLDDLATNLEKSAAGSNMDPDLLSLLKEILAMLKGEGSTNSNTSGSEGSGDKTQSLIDRLFDNNPATANMDPSLVSILKELLSLLLAKKDDKGSTNNSDTVSDKSQTEDTDTNKSASPSDASIEEMISELLGSSEATKNLDPAVLSILKELLSFLLGKNTDNKMADPVTPSKADNLFDPSEKHAGGDSELRSLISELMTHLLGTAPESSTKKESSTDTGSETRETKTVSPDYSSTKKVDPSDEKQTKTTETTTEKSDLSKQGDVIVVNEPIVVDGGVFDGKGATYTASSKLGDGGQSETQSPIFILKNGATLKNVSLGENGADGIHVYGGATLENVNWQNVGEDALTVKSAGDVTIIGGSAKGATDKIFQINADTNFYLKDFVADGFTTLVRTNGGKQIDADVTIDGGSFSNGSNVFRTDSSLASVTFQSDITLKDVKNWTRVGDKQSGT
jgi:hypothetical protein